MATVIRIGGSNYGGEIQGAIEGIRSGFATLNKWEVIRANSIGLGSPAGPDQIEDLFDVKNDQGQTYSDRVANLMAAYNNLSNTEFAKLHDVIDAILKI